MLFCDTCYTFYYKLSIREKVLYIKSFLKHEKIVTSVTADIMKGDIMDFYQIQERTLKNGIIEVYPEFIVCRSKDVMVRGKTFYAIWDELNKVWSTDEYDVQRIVDHDIKVHVEKVKERNEGIVKGKFLSKYSTRAWSEFKNYITNLPDNYKQLDVALTFSNDEVTKKDYVSRKLPYPLQEGPIDSYDELIGTIYDEEERAKLEWAVGAIVAGDAKNIQKFIVLYGDAGTGKSTFINIIQKLFEGYYTTFEAKALTSSSNSFSAEVFRSNPLVAIQHDGDLSRIEDNSKLNSIVSHEEMQMNEKYKSSYTTRINSFLFMGSNKAVKITDAKSGIIRRLIDVKPSGKKVTPKRYQVLYNQIDFELGAIAYHCLSVYRKMGKNYYASYRPIDMMLQTDVFFNFVESHYQVFYDQDGVSLAQAYEMYKTYCDESMVEYKLARHKFREELRNYFDSFDDVTRVDGKQVRSYYSGFQSKKFKHQKPVKVEEEHPDSLSLDSDKSIFNEIYSSYPAQYANYSGTPKQKWEEVTTTLADIDTSQLHYVRPPINHIVIDFDLKDATGEKSASLNIAAASKFPPTYAEYSKSGNGVHLHYLYEGDAEQLSRIYDEGIEIKVFSGNSSLRRQFSKSNNISIAKINSGLPLKGVKMLDFDGIVGERTIKELIARNLRKEIHAGTKPSMDFIKKILDDAYESGVKYDVTDMKPAIINFAMNSTNQSDYCMKLLPDLKYQSSHTELDRAGGDPEYTDDRLVFYDIEVYPNLFLLCWKYKGDSKVTRMYNPKPHLLEPLLKNKLVGFNCRRYDNHVLYAAYMGYDNEQLYKLSAAIVGNAPNALFREAYNLSFADVYDYTTDKMSLKKWQVKLGLPHIEMDIPWNEPAPEELWDKIGGYCDNDVISTEAVFEYTEADFAARQMLSELTGLPVNATTQKHAAKLMFGNDPNPTASFIYTDLSEMFPGYKYEMGKSTYRGEVTGEGGYVYAEPGMYDNVMLRDVESLHPWSLINMNYFGKYTKTFKELVLARVAIKHKDIESLKKLFNGVLVKYITSEDMWGKLAYALKIVINSVYGFTSAKFDNPFKHPKNVDNIVAKRGALFMIDLKHAVQELGYTVAHIKTDSIKIPNADAKIGKFIDEFGAKYGYKFVHEATYSKMALVNDAVYIAKYGWAEKEKDIGKWTATGAQFAEPYVFKTLFSKEPLLPEDYAQTRSVSTAMYIGEPGPDQVFIGKVGKFVPVKPGTGGGPLMRISKDGSKFDSVSKSKGHEWMSYDTAIVLKKELDMSFYRKLADTAINDISVFGDFEMFTNDHDVENSDNFMGGVYQETRSGNDVEIINPLWYTKKEEN